MKELNLTASDDTLYTVLDEVREMLVTAGATEDQIIPITIAVEEVYVNIAHYAYGGKPGEAIVGMEIEQEPRAIKLVFKDRGIPYNPLEKEDPDITLSAEERGIGGLGIFMVKNTMDKVEYEYSGGQNILSMEKAF